jgi:hypothetical protein
MIAAAWNQGGVTLYLRFGESQRFLQHQLCHQLAHQWTQMVDPTFGEKLVAANGHGDISFPSLVSAGGLVEQMAELVTYYRLGEDGGLPWRPQFETTKEAQELMDTNFGGCSGKVEVR